MATPLAGYTNARLLIQAPGTRGGADTGYKRTGGNSTVISLFLKQFVSGNNYKQVENASINHDTLEGYMVAWCPLPEGEDWRTLDVANQVGADTSGKRPATLLKGGRPMALRYGERSSENVELLEVTGSYGEEGIGAIVRNVMGDKIILKVEWRQ